MDQIRASSETPEDSAAGLPALQGTASDATLRRVLIDVLGVNADAVAAFTAETGLFGHLPELDSMAVATLLTEIEDRFHIVIDDDEVDGELLETYGALLAFIDEKSARG